MKEQMRGSHALGGLSWPNELGVLGLLFSFALLLRLPFFFPAVLDWDESTLVLIGQSILDGHLPYVDLWDVKPPIAFAFHALVIAVYGKDLVGIRLAGTLCVVVTAFLVHLTANRLWSRRTGIVSATLCIAAISLLKSGQATMTEHIVLPPLVGAMYLLIRREETVGSLFLLGMLMAVATLIRLNIAYLVIIVGLYILGSSAVRSKKPVQSVSVYAFGGMLVVGVTWLPYALAGQQEAWWVAMISAPLSYSNSQYSFIESLILEVKHAFGIYRGETGYRFRVPWLNAFVWLGAIGGLAIVWRGWERIGQVERRGITLLILFMLGTGFGILMSGGAQEHYLIQVVPFAVLLAAALLQQFPRYLRCSSLLMVGVLVVASAAPIFAEYKIMVSRFQAHKDLRHGAAYEIAAYLKRENTRCSPVYLLTDHIAYWFIGSYPLTRMTAHPSIIARPYLLQVAVGRDASTEEELTKVFRRSPEFVVTRANIWYLQGSPKTLLEEILANEYVLATEIEGRKIYRRKPTPSSPTKP